MDLVSIIKLQRKIKKNKAPHPQAFFNKLQKGDSLLVCKLVTGQGAKENSLHEIVAVFLHLASPLFLANSYF
jgi:hypothetical protein